MCYFCSFDKGQVCEKYVNTLSNFFKFLFFFFGIRQEGKNKITDTHTHIYKLNFSSQKMLLLSADKKQHLKIVWHFFCQRCLSNSLWAKFPLSRQHQKQNIQLIQLLSGYQIVYLSSHLSLTMEQIKIICGSLCVRSVCGLSRS